MPPRKRPAIYLGELFLEPATSSDGPETRPPQPVQGKGKVLHFPATPQALNYITREFLRGVRLKEVARVVGTSTEHCEKVVRDEVKRQAPGLVYLRRAA